MAIGLALFVFLAIGTAIALFGYRRYVRAGQVYENLQPASAAVLPSGLAPGVPGFYAITQLVERVGLKLPPDPKKASRYRRELIAAGYRATNAVAVYYGLKIALVALFALLALGLQTRIHVGVWGRFAYVAIAALGGFRLPDFVLARRVKTRRRKLRQALPDALDLMVVCAESGLAIDRTLRLVGRELALVHPVLSDELNLLGLEMTAGTRRKEALENLAIRTGEPEVRKFVTVLIQADRFGTEIAEALRVHADYLRVRRRIEAEERAGKVAVKLVFPIFLFILPCILLVTLGPAAIQISKVLLPAMTGK
jgi:tight adherence protein C